MEQRNRVFRLATRVLADEYLDLYVLAAAALVFTVLGATGVASIADLASMILALLTVLAFSQIRSRRQIAGIANAQRADPFSLFEAEFPADLIKMRASATDLMLIGITMSRTVQGSSREDMRQTLLHGGRIRVLLLDPTDDSLLEQTVSRHGANLSAQRLKARIQATLDELTSLQASTNGKLEIRVAAFVPSMGVNAINCDGPQGVLVVQHYQHKPPAEAAPIISLEARDGSWYGHFLAEAERMWQDGRPWPLDAAQVLTRAPRPAFLEAFGAELGRSMSGARDLLITGVARNTLLTSSYGDFEEWLRHGCQVRFCSSIRPRTMQSHARPNGTTRNDLPAPCVSGSAMPSAFLMNSNGLQAAPCRCVLPRIRCPWGSSRLTVRHLIGPKHRLSFTATVVRDHAGVCAGEALRRGDRRLPRS